MSPTRATLPESLPCRDRVVLLYAALLLIAGVAVYANSFEGVFLFDDVHAILNNPRIRQLWPPGRILDAERPVVELSLALNFVAGGLRTGGYHAVNLVVHLFAALALFGLIRRTLLVESPGVAAYPVTVAGTAFAVALLWTIHPLQTESVTYIIQRGESMMSMFCLLTLYSFVRAAEPNASRAWRFISIGSCAAAMGCKAVAVVLPIVVFLFDWLCIGRSLREVRNRRLWFHVAMGMTWLVLLATGIVGQILAPTTDRIAVGLGYKGISPWNYLLTQSQVIVHYLRLSFLPDTLCLDYAWPAARNLGQVLVPGVVILALLSVTVWAIIRAPRIGFAGACFFLLLAPTSSVIPVRDFAVEHRMYLPLAAVLVVTVVAIRAVIARARLRPAPRRVLEVTILVVASVTLGGWTFVRNRAYHDELAMWRDVAAKQPRNARAQVNIGVLLERGEDFTGAVEAYQRALGIDNAYSDAHFNLAVAFLRMKRTEEGEKELHETLRFAPDDPGAHSYLGDLLSLRRDFEGALTEFRTALKVVPQDAMLHAKVCTALRRLQRVAEAVPACQEAVRLGPNVSFAHESMGHIHIARGDMAAAIPSFQRTVELDPRNAFAWGNLGTTLKSEGRLEESIDPYRRAIALRPEEPYAHLQVADSLMALNRVDEAVAEFETTLGLAPQDLDARLSYARALRHAGRIAEAAKQYDHVLRTKPDQPEAVQAVKELSAGP